MQDKPNKENASLGIVDYLPSGEASAISWQELARALGLGNDKRSLQRAIAREREAGKVILSSHKGGYFLPGSREEISKFVRTNEKKAKRTLKVLGSAKKVLKEIEGQTSL